MPEPTEPLRWTAESNAESRAASGGPLYYTAPGGWMIVNEPSVHAPDRPWLLRLHGQHMGRFHTLRLAKSAPTRPDLLTPL